MIRPPPRYRPVPMQRSPLLMLVTLLTAFNMARAIDDIAPWYTPFLIGLAVIGLAALLIRNDRNDPA